ncbi:MAG: GNAT family N-acetyltransferase, partial [Candidatus Acidiferrales bacterium]
RYPRLQLTRGDEAAYQRFRCREPNLVSYLDEHGSGGGQRRLQVLVLRAQGQPVGTVSFIVETNRYRPSQANKFARIDLVMVDPSCRGLGFGRLLILCVMTYLLRAHGKSLYSISCLAAHAAVEKSLQELAFAGRPQKDENFQHMELKLEALDLDRLARQLAQKTATRLQAINFRLRQQENAPSR